MKIIFKRSPGVAGYTIDQRGKENPEISSGASILEEGIDYIIEEREKKELTEIVFEYMNMSVYIPKD